jgi:hypothetical protein
VEGSLKITCADDTETTMNFTAGEERSVQVKRLWSTGTTTITAADLEIAYHD